MTASLMPDIIKRGLPAVAWAIVRGKAIYVAGLFMITSQFILEEDIESKKNVAKEGIPEDISF